MLHGTSGREWVEISERVRDGSVWLFGSEIDARIPNVSALHTMDFLNKFNSALMGPAGKTVPPAVETIQKITDRLTQATLLSDRRAAVLSLKSLTREWKEAVGEHSLLALIAVLEVDAKEDPDICKAVLETLVALCDVETPGDDAPPERKTKVAKDDLGLKHTDGVLQV